VFSDVPLPVPIIVFVTKGDGLASKYFSALREEGVKITEARKRAVELAENDFNEKISPYLKSQYTDKPPSGIIFLRGSILHLYERYNIY
jgi:hypothetical protein